MKFDWLESSLVLHSYCEQISNLDVSPSKENVDEDVCGLKIIAELAMKLLEVCVHKVDAASSKEIV